MKYPLLQSGFLSLTEAGLEQGAIDEPTLHQSVLNKRYLVHKNPYFYSKDVTSLFNRWSANPDLIKEFDFRDEIIKVTMASFACPSFYRWLVLQKESPALSQLHRMFLIDLLESLIGSGQRLMEPVQWISLLETNTAEKTEEIKIEIESYFDQFGKSAQFLPSSFYDIVQLWLSRPQGFEDLLTTLYIIFGKRDQRTDVANK